MQRVIVAVLGIAVAVVIGGIVVTGLSGRSAVYGLASKPPASVKTLPGVQALFDLERNSLVSRGISPARADQALNAQSAVAHANLVGTIKDLLRSSFAGVWFDPKAARLYVGVTSQRSRRLVETAVARSGLGNYVSETSVHSSWDELVKEQKQWNERLGGLFARDRAETALQAEHNSVSVRLSSAVSAGELASFKRVASAAPTAVAISVERTPRLTFTPDAGAECAAFKEDAANCNKTITSGVTIEMENKFICSAGPLAVPKASKSETYLLTAGHCILKPINRIGSKWFAYTKTGTKEPIGPATEAIWSSKADIGAIKVNNPGFWVNTGTTPVFAGVAEWTKVASTAFQVEGQREPMDKDTTCHEGNTTGQLCGMILATNVTGGSLKTEGLVEVEVNEGKETLEGDSGGPWLFIQTKAGNTVLMEGTEVGSATSNAKHSAYEPVKTALKELKGLDMELLTKGNESGR